MKFKFKNPARNLHARALRARAGNAAVEVKLDTRPKIVQAKKGKNSYRRVKSMQWCEA
jgi:stalled ribosome alternative rescue factor ArfA